LAEIGTVLGGRYRVMELLGQGGMARIYRGHDNQLDRDVAIKILRPEYGRDPDFGSRFRHEAQAAASLNHPNIVSVYDYGQDAAGPFIVMELVDGEDLASILKRSGALPPRQAARVTAEAARALHAAHQRGIVHRDVKPGNIMIDRDGRVKVADFGIARAANALQGLTMPGTVLGTATYLSPEQAQGTAVDHRTDVYSLGMVLYEMLAGRSPFTGDTPVAIAYQAVRDTPPVPSTHNARVPPALDAVVMKAMAKSPAARQQSADELRAELLAVDRAVGDPDATVAVARPGAAEATAVVAGPSTSVLPPAVAPEPPEPVRRSPAGAVPPSVYRRRRAAVVAGLALLAVLAAVVLVSLSRGGSTGAVDVPDVVGRSVPDATAALDRAGLKSQVTEQDRAGTAGQVAAQDPPAKARASRGSTVTLFVPRGATSTTARTATTPATTATTQPTTTAAPTTVAPTTTVARTTVAPTTSIVVPTTVVVTTTRP
jgi:tRNA A-37 threonylcarbamoyl transferase component Bud32